MIDRADPDATERLWAPWRLGYIKGAERPDPPPEPRAWLPGADRDCFLCRAAAEPSSDDADFRQLVVARDEHVVVLLNRYPYSNCHLLVSPRRHVAELSDLTDEEHLAAMRRMARLTDLLRDRIGAQGFNIGPQPRRQLLAPACRGTCTGTACRVGPAITTSCPPSPA